MSHCKPYPAYRDSGVEWLGMVPEHWQVKPLKRVLRLITERAGTCDWQVALENIEGWTGRFSETESEFSGEGISFNPGDILFGKLRPYLAKAYVAPRSGEAVGDFFVLRPIADGESEFLHRYILTPVVIEQINAATEGAKMPRASWDDMGLLPVAIPERDEQIQIVQNLDRETARIDALVAKKTRFIELLREKRQALITHAVTKGLDPNVKMKDSGVEWLGEVPEHWDVKPLKYVGAAIIGLTYSPDDVVGEDEGVLVLRASNIQNGRLVLGDNVYVRATIPTKLVTREGDILICSRNGSRALIGKNALIGQDASGLSFGAFTTVFRSAANQFVYYVLNSALFKFQSGRFLTTTINQLTTETLTSFEVPLPPPRKQIEISEWLTTQLEKLDALASRTERSIELLKERRSALITAAVTGQIDLREAV